MAQSSNEIPLVKDAQDPDGPECLSSIMQLLALSGTTWPSLIPSVNCQLWAFFGVKGLHRCWAQIGQKWQKLNYNSWSLNE